MFASQDVKQIVKITLLRGVQSVALALTLFVLAACGRFDNVKRAHPDRVKRTHPPG